MHRRSSTLLVPFLETCQKLNVIAWRMHESDVEIIITPCETQSRCSPMVRFRNSTSVKWTHWTGGQPRMAKHTDRRSFLRTPFTDLLVLPRPVFVLANLPYRLSAFARSPIAIRVQLSLSLHGPR